MLLKYKHYTLDLIKGTFTSSQDELGRVWKFRIEPYQDERYVVAWCQPKDDPSHWTYWTGFNTSDKAIEELHKTIAELELLGENLDEIKKKLPEQDQRPSPEIFREFKKTPGKL